MSVNDLIAQGCRPLFFLDYFACGLLEEKVFNRVLKGIKKGLRKADCCLIGGEIAEMPGIYRRHDYDLAGFACGILVKQERRKIKQGDYIVGLKSNGVHSNGFSLIRKIFTKKEIKKYKDLFLKPTRIYSEFLKHPRIFNLAKGLAHVTGGGIKRALNRLLPQNLDAEILPFKISSVFQIIAKKGIDRNEMLEVFNMGWGMLLVADEKDIERIQEKTGGEIIGIVRKK
jgi:phosphoribosylformylglycinamidine cyclo-ligase